MVELLAHKVVLIQGQTDRQTDIHVVRESDRQTDRKTNKQTNRNTQFCVHVDQSLAPLMLYWCCLSLQVNATLIKEMLQFSRALFPGTAAQLYPHIHVDR